MHLADLKAYLEADQRLLGPFADKRAWACKLILSFAGPRKFSSDPKVEAWPVA